MDQATQAVPQAAVTPETSYLIEEWATWLRDTKNCATGTVRLYRSTVEDAHKTLPGLVTASPEVLERFVQDKGGAPSTILNRCCALTSFFRFLVKYKYRSDNPAAEIDRPKIPQRIPKPIKNIKAVLDAMDREDQIANQYAPGSKRRVGETRDMAVFLFKTGLRIHEAVKFDAPVPCPEEWIVIGKGNKEELIQLDDQAREIWDRLGGKWPIGARGTQRRFEKIRHIERVTPHMWRHTLATVLVEEGVEIGRVSKVMRHSSPTTTMGYAAFSKKQNREALAVLPKV